MGLKASHCTKPNIVHVGQHLSIVLKKGNTVVVPSFDNIQKYYLNNTFRKLYNIYLSK